MIATTIEQSKRLIELGLNTNTADMRYEEIPGIQGEYKLVFSKPNNKWEIPAWSLSALLGLIKPVNENTYTIQGTLDGGAIISFEEVTSVAFQENNILDAVFEMVKYLLENKLI